MKRYLGISFGVFCGALLVAGIAVAKPVQQPLQTTNFDFMESDVVGDVDGSPAPSKALQDTFWIADWTFDTGAPCSNAGWLRWDNRILNVNDDAAFWHIDNRFDAAPNVDGQAAYLSKHDLCWASDGYGNENDFSIIIPYAEDSDPTTDVELAFSGRYHCEAGFDWMTVEVDPLGQSEALTNLNVNPEATPETFRTQVMQVSSMTPVDFDTVLVLPTQALGTSEVYIRFESDGALSDEDGIDSFDTDAAIIIDNIVVRRAVSGVPTTTLYSENFEDGDLDAPAVMIETALSTGLSGSPWWRTLPHLTDNDKCVEDLTCAWIDTDPTRIAFLPSMNFGPGQAVVRGWLDDQMTTPWASFATTPGATGTLLTFRVFPGNNSAEGEIRLNYSVRVKIRQDNTDSVADMSDSIDCFSPWGHVFQWFNLSSFTWGTSIQNMTPFFNPLGTEVQVRFREADWQLETLANNPPPMTYNPGPGAYLDRIRIARRVLSGPVINEGIDSRTQAQDAFPTVQNAIAPGQHFSPDADNRFGTCAFSEGTDLGINTTSTNLITGDSIQLEQVIDSRGAGGVTSVKFYGAIVAGPHTGKVPGPYSTVGGFFEVNADSARNTSGNVVANRWFIDLDDTYFRGGDVMKYFWAATDAGMPIGFSSTPSGLTALPSSVAQAETATGGLHEVNYLPTVNWPAAYLTAVAGSMTGDVTYDPMVHGAATQKNCILYYQRQNTRRRSGAANRTTFQLTLDQLGFAGDYDTYDTQGGGNSVNQLAGRANVAQASGYSLIVQDDGRSIVFDVNIPAGQNPDSDQLDQAGWYRSYLANAASGFAGSATLWLIGESTALESTTESNPLITTDFGLTNIIEDQALSLNPNVRGVASQTWANGNSTAFGGDEFALQGGCPAIRNYDMASSTAGSTVTHRYAVGATLSTGGAIVMNRNAGLSWNTVWQGFAFQDIRFAGTPTNPTPRQSLASRIIAQTVPAMCVGGTPTGNGQDPVVDAPPAVSSLHQNVPNPFNPTTKISFDLAREGQVKLQVFNVAGHLVKTLVDGAMPAKRGHEVVWNGLDEAGNRVPSGVYFYQLVTDDLTATKKMALLK